MGTGPHQAVGVHLNRLDVAPAPEAALRGPGQKKHACIADKAEVCPVSPGDA